MSEPIVDESDRDNRHALLWSPSGVTVVECAEPVPYRLSVEHGVSEALLDPRGWVS